MDQDYTIGIEEIDRQHTELLERMELLRDYMRRGQGRGVIMDTLRFLESYAAEHFATEVKYMQRYHYPELLSHKAEHEVFVKDLAAIKEKFTAAHSQGDVTPFMIIEVVRKLNDWFTDHILTVDRKMGAFLAEKRQQ